MASIESKVSCSVKRNLTLIHKFKQLIKIREIINWNKACKVLIQNNFYIGSNINGIIYLILYLTLPQEVSTR